MADPQIVFVQSISSLGGKAVVGTVIDPSSAIVQWTIPVDALGKIPANVRSYLGGAGLCVVPINTNGDPIHFPALADYRSAVSSLITTSADHLLLTGTSGKRVYVSALTISAESVGGLAYLKDSGGVLWSANIPPQDMRHFAFPTPIKGTLTSSLVFAFQNSGAQGTAAVTAFDA